METEKYKLNKRLAELSGKRIAEVGDAPFRDEDSYLRYRENYPDTVWAFDETSTNIGWEQYVFTSDWDQLMPIAVELGVTYAVESSWSGQFVAFQMNNMYQGCDDRHSFEMVNAVYGDDLKVAMVECCIKALEDLAKEEAEYQAALAERCPELSKEIVELSTQKTFKITKKSIR